MHIELLLANIRTTWPINVIYLKITTSHHKSTTLKHGGLAQWLVPINEVTLCRAQQYWDG